VTVTVGRTKKATQTSTLKVGDSAPDFTLPTHLGRRKGAGSNSAFSLGELRGKKNVVLAFFPMAFTSVCSAEMPSLEADLDRFARMDAEVVGISVDNVAVLQAWAPTIGGITFPLASDFWPHGGVAQMYGILQPGGYAERANFIVDKNGRIVYIDVHEGSEQPDVEELLEVLRKL
jgi:mycoredoxin-dependent peroxiredoxin